MAKLYLVSGDTSDDRFSIDINVFGIYDSLSKAQNASTQLSYATEIHEIMLNETTEIHLGSYLE